MRDGGIGGGWVFAFFVEGWEEGWGVWEGEIRVCDGGGGLVGWWLWKRWVLGEGGLLVVVGVWCRRGGGRGGSSW